MTDNLTSAPKGFTLLYRLYLETFARVMSGAVLTKETFLLAEVDILGNVIGAARLDDDELKAIVMGAEHAKSGSRWSPDDFAEAVENWCGGGDD